MKRYNSLPARDLGVPLNAPPHASWSREDWLSRRACDAPVLEDGVASCTERRLVARARETAPTTQVYRCALGSQSCAASPSGRAASETRYLFRTEGASLQVVPESHQARFRGYAYNTVDANAACEGMLEDEGHISRVVKMLKV